MEQVITARSLSQSVAGDSFSSAHRAATDDTEDEIRSKQNDVIWTPVAAVTGVDRPSVKLRQPDAGVYGTSTGTGTSSSASATSSASASGEDTSCVVYRRRHDSDVTEHDTSTVTHILGIRSDCIGGVRGHNFPILGVSSSPV